MFKTKPFFHLSNFPLDNRTVLVRVDYNVPLEKKTDSKRADTKKIKSEKGIIADNTKIKVSLPTIKYLLSKNCKIILMTHLGDPEGKVVPELKVDLLAEELKNLLPQEKITKLNDCIGKDIKAEILLGRQKEIFLLENLRFYKEEENNDSVFAQSLAHLADVYINDAFSVCHRKHASLDAITNYLPAIAGASLETEIEEMSKALQPKHPAIWIMGGAKLNKIDLIKNALEKADTILIGGALAFAFLRAKGVRVGMSKVDGDSVNLAKKLLQEKAARRIILPVDFMVAEEFSLRAKTEVVRFNEIKSNQIALDIGPKTINLFKHHLMLARTIVWNGPLGYFEWAKFSLGTKEIGRFIGKFDKKKVTTICGGGDTAAAMRKFYLEHNFTHVSTGGGAALDFLSGKKMPGIAALEKNWEKFRKKVRLR